MKVKPTKTKYGYLYREVRIANPEPELFVIEWQIGIHKYSAEYTRLIDTVFYIDKLLDS